jgi:molybdopterin synthase sulfur carrier subunit
MPTVTLASAIARHLAAGPGERSFAVEGGTVREALEAMLLQAPGLRGYVLDDQGALRHHVAAFVNNVVVRDKRTLAEPVPADAEIYLVQALSGG